MGKRLFATKASTLKDKIITVDDKVRYNSSVYKDIQEKSEKASRLHDLQLAVETFAKNLGMTYTKAADGDEVAQLTLKSKLKQFYNSWRKKADNGIKKEYLFYFYQGTEDNSSENDSDIIERKNEGGLFGYFECNLDGETLEIVRRNGMNTTEERGKTLQKYVEETAEIWRKEKQKLKKEAQTQLKKIKKVCKTVKKYEDWFGKYGIDKYLNKLDAKKLAKLKIQAENKWKKYCDYITNADNNKYLIDNYAGGTFYTEAQKNYAKIAGKTAEKTAIN